MNEKKRIPSPEESLLTEELLRLSCRRMQARASRTLAANHRTASRRGNRRYFRAFALLMLMLMTATGLLVAQRYPYVMNVPAGVDRETVNRLADQIIMLA